MSVPRTKKGKLELKPALLHLNLTRTLNRFLVTNCSIQSGSANISLVIELERLSGPFWISLFIPSICLVLAAEMTLFIDEKHFKATIAVALTATLTMYTLYNSFQEKLPDDSTLKLIDIWLLHGLLMPMVVFVILTTNELIIESEDKTTLTTTKVSNSAVLTSKALRPDKQKKDKLQKKRKQGILICKVSVPIISAVFIFIFFMVIYSK